MALLLALVALVATAAGCRDGGDEEGPAVGPGLEGPAATPALGEPARSDRVLDVVATTSVLAEWARTVGGPNVRVHVAVKAGLDPVSYLATTADVEALRRAQVVLSVGRGLEPWLAGALQQAGAKAPVAVLSEGAPEKQTPSGRPDPFLWQDADVARQLVVALTSALSAADPADAPAFAAAAERLNAALSKADAEARRILAPLAGQPVVTAKEDLGWFTARYGLRWLGGVVPSTSAADEPTPEHLTAIRAAVAAARPAAVVGESSTPEGPLLALAREQGLRAVVGPDSLHAAGLGRSGSGADTWAGALVHDARVLAEALRG